MQISYTHLKFAVFTNTICRSGFICLLLGLCLVLQACVPLILGGAVTGSTIVADRRTVGTQLVDESLDLSVGTAIDKALRGEGNISVLSYNRHVLLTGQAQNAADKALTTATTRNFLDATIILNQLIVGPGATFSEKAADTLLTAKVKSTLIAEPKVPFRTIKVTTQRGVVYFMGLLTESEARLTASVIGSIPGVKKVVNAAQIITPLELETIQERLEPPVQT